MPCKFAGSRVGNFGRKTRQATVATNVSFQAEIQEFGGPPVIIPMTPKMRRFLFAMLRKSGQAPPGGTGSGVVVVQVPARPFLRPAFNNFRTGSERRFLERVAEELGKGF